MAERTVAESSRWLQAILGYDAADLEANRSGRLGTSQAARLHESVAQMRRLLRIVGVFALAATPLILFMVDITRGDPGIVLLAASPVPILVALFLWKRRQFLADVSAETVEVVEGPLRKQVYRSTRGGVAYLLHVGGRRLQVSRDAFGLFESGNAYRLYVTPASKTVVAAEVMEA